MFFSFSEPSRRAAPLVASYGRSCIQLCSLIFPSSLPLPGKKLASSQLVLKIASYSVSFFFFVTRWTCHCSVINSYPYANDAFVTLIWSVLYLYSDHSIAAYFFILDARPIDAVVFWVSRRNAWKVPYPQEFNAIVLNKSYFVTMSKQFRHLK